ncbi:hypothetical protein ACGFZP_13370 [Kitasatospora sp. NPDC048239]|uniref:hypothetical protein n=1 Tax=Kitasatospora sp. NPDC048239 TaxID=3364046 RepID=UPI00371CF9DA
MATTTSYGTWYNHTKHNSSPEGDILDFINGGGTDWCERVDECGAFERMASDYRAAVQAALPDGVYLTGDEFIGPAYDDDTDFDGYPADEYDDLDLGTIIDSVDLTPIVERWDPDAEWTTEQVADRIGASSIKSASKTLHVWGITATGRQPGRSGQNLYSAELILNAMAARPGQGTRTDLKDSGE